MSLSDNIISTDHAGTIIIKESELKEAIKKTISYLEDEGLDISEGSERHKVFCRIFGKRLVR